MTLTKISILESALREGGGGHSKAYSMYAFINVDNCERPLNRMDSTNQAGLPAVARAHCDVFQAGLPWQGMAKLFKGSIFCHHGDTICHPKAGYVTTKLHGTSTCGCNNNAMFSGRAIFTFPTAVVSTIV